MSAFWHFVTKEWYFSSPMFLLLLVATVLVVWRILLNLNARTNMNEFLPAFQDKLEKEGIDGALRSAAPRPASSHASSTSPAWKRRSRVWPPCAAPWPMSSSWKSCPT